MSGRERQRDMRSRRLYGLVTKAKRLLPTGAPFDNSLNYIQAWNQLEYPAESRGAALAQ